MLWRLGVARLQLLVGVRDMHLLAHRAALWSLHVCGQARKMVGDWVCTCSAKVHLHRVWRAADPSGSEAHPQNCQAMPQPLHYQKTHRSTHNTRARVLDAGYARGLFRDGPYRFRDGPYSYSHPRSY